MTDLLKNRDDNETKMQIAMQEGFNQLQYTAVATTTK